MRYWRLAPLAIALVLAPPVAAEDPALAQAQSTHPVRAVVELFTSQGCSSCPPADALLKTYADADDVIAMTLPVDYWDYIGWKDTLAAPRNTERQRAYAANFAVGPLYTPQVVVNGAAQALGSSRDDIDRAIESTGKQLADRRMPLHVWNFSNSIIVEAGGAPATADVKDATIWLAIVEKSVDVPIRAGENGGKTLTYYNVVREMTPVGLWNGRPTTIRLARGALMRPDAEKLVVLVQEENTGAIIGAARLGD
jgi:hypothetical protein